MDAQVEVNVTIVMTYGILKEFLARTHNKNILLYSYILKTDS